ncbi:MAG: hypothetical protein ABSC46_05010 [Candidatus Limnocylindrales bacterium]
MFNRRQPEVEDVGHVDLIDLLLDADEATRRRLMSQAIQSGALNRSEAEDLMTQAARLELAAGPRPSEPKPEPEHRAAWGIDYP